MSITLDELVGQDFTTVKEKLENAGLKYRIKSKDGEFYILTQDIIPSRFNLTVNHDIVTQVSMG